MESLKCAHLCTDRSVRSLVSWAYLDAKVPDERTPLHADILVRTDQGFSGWTWRVASSATTCARVRPRLRGQTGSAELVLFTKSLLQLSPTN